MHVGTCMFICFFYLEEHLGIELIATLIVKPYLTVSTNYFYLIFIFIKISKLDMKVALYLL